MHNHNHNHCSHMVKYCQICDVAYCSKCGKEWRNGPQYYYPYRWGGAYTVEAKGFNVSKTHVHGESVNT